MSNLPVPWEGGRPSRELVRATKAQRRTELAIFRHALEARYVTECERLDAQALSDVVRTALEEEISNLDWGLEQAGGSVAKTELVARKSAMQAQINSDRISRHFGGR
jgi:hypothetical protein